MMSMMQSVFSDTAWSVWEPLIEEVRPKGQDPTEEPSTDDICDLLAPSERCKMARSAI
jgi:hypothetical protein